MEIIIEHRGIQLTLDAYNEDGIDLFTVVAIESTDAPYDVAELAKLLVNEGQAIHLLASDELDSQRELARIHQDEERAA